MKERILKENNCCRNKLGEKKMKKNIQNVQQKKKILNEFIEVFNSQLKFKI